MSKTFVYLAGPIAGLDKDAANNWRDDVSKQLFDISDGSIVGVSPLRCEPPNLDGLYDDQLSIEARTDWFATSRCINAKNWLDTVKCDAILAYFPKSLCENRPSYGTIIEMGWAIALRKPLFVCSDDQYLVKHPLIDQNASYVGEDLNDTTSAIVDLFGVYSG